MDNPARNQYSSIIHKLINDAISDTAFDDDGEVVTYDIKSELKNTEHEITVEGVIKFRITYDEPAGDLPRECNHSDNGYFEGTVMIYTLDAEELYHNEEEIIEVNL